MSLFDDDDFVFGNELPKHKLRRAIKTLFELITKPGWRAKITLWNPDTGEEWEVIPTSSLQTKKPTQHLECTVQDVEIDQDSPI